MIWKEAHIRLKANREYCHNMSTGGNCIIVLNRDTIIKIGMSPGNFERTVKPNDVGVLVRPFPLKQVFILSETDTTIKLIETKEDNVTTQFLHQQEIPIDANIINTVGLRPTDLNLDVNKNAGVNVVNTPNISVIDTVSLKPIDLNIDANKNVGVLVNNNPKVDQTDIYSILSNSQSSTNAALAVTLDTSLLCRPIINIFIETNVNANFNISISNDNIAFRTRHTLSLTQNTNTLYTFNNNAYRYIKVETTTPGNHTIEITATR